MDFLKPCHTLNQATLLPDSSGPITHVCPEVTDQVYSSHRGLQREPSLNAEEVWFVDGSSFMKNGQRRAGYAVVSLHATIEAKGLTPGTSAQKAEIIA